jgi:hypothetical protein
MFPFSAITLIQEIYLSGLMSGLGASRLWHGVVSEICLFCPDDWDSRFHRMSLLSWWLRQQVPQNVPSVLMIETAGSADCLFCPDDWDSRFRRMPLLSWRLRQQVPQNTSSVLKIETAGSAECLFCPEDWDRRFRRMSLLSWWLRQEVPQNVSSVLMIETAGSAECLFCPDDWDSSSAESLLCLEDRDSRFHRMSLLSWRLRQQVPQNVSSVLKIETAGSAECLFCPEDWDSRFRRMSLLSWRLRQEVPQNVSSVLKIDAADCSETSIVFCQTTWHHIPRDYNVNSLENRQCHNKQRCSHLGNSHSLYCMHKSVVSVNTIL